MSSTFRCAATVCVALALGHSGRVAASQETLTEKLLRSGVVACKPRVTHYCRNIHIGCSGRSRIETYPFVVTLDGRSARISDARPEGDQPVRPGRVEPARDLEHIAVWLDPPPEAIKLNADGTYSYRIRWRGVDYNSYGRCR